MEVGYWEMLANNEKVYREILGKLRTVNPEAVVVLDTLEKYRINPAAIIRIAEVFSKLANSGSKGKDLVKFYISRNKRTKKIEIEFVEMILSQDINKNLFY